MAMAPIPPFGADEHPCAPYFDVHQGYRVLTHSHICLFFCHDLFAGRRAAAAAAHRGGRPAGGKALQGVHPRVKPGRLGCNGWQPRCDVHRAAATNGHTVIYGFWPTFFSGALRFDVHVHTVDGRDALNMYPRPKF